MWIGYVGVIVGGIARILFPWLVKLYRNQATNFEKRYLRGQLVAIVIFVFLLPLLIDMNTVSGVDFYAAWLMGWAAGDIGRLLDSTGTEVVSRVKNKLNGG